MKKSSTVTSVVAAIAIFGLLLSGGVFAFTTRIQASQTNSGNQMVLDDSNGEGHNTQGGHDSQTSTSQTTTETETENSNNEQNAGSHHLSLHLVPASLPAGATAPAGYAFGRGTAQVEIDGTSLKVEVQIHDAAPNTAYKVVMTVSGGSSASTANQMTLGTLTTNHEGEGQMNEKISLSLGTYQIGIQLLDTTNFGSGTPAVMQSDPSTETLTLSETSTTSQTESETETETRTSGEHEGENQGQHELNFRIVPASQSMKGQGEANIAIHGTVLKVDVEIEKAAPSTTYSVLLFVSLTSGPGSTISPPSVSSSTSLSETTTVSPPTTSTSTTASNQVLGTIMTSDEGDGHLHTEITLAAGTYLLGITLSVSGTVQLVSDPATKTAVLTGKTREGEEGEGIKTGRANQVVKGGKEDEDSIKNAEDSKEIPAVIQVTSSGSVATVLDPKFSVSIGKVGGDGLAISISANNVTGPRVLLINLTNSVDLTSHSLNVTLDGQPITEASSLAQVLSPSTSDPPRFLIVTTTSGSQLLVSIPHFSLHLLQVLPLALAQSETSLSVYAELIAAAAVAIAVVFVVAYKMRGIRLRRLGSAS